MIEELQNQNTHRALEEFVAVRDREVLRNKNASPMRLKLSYKQIQKMISLYLKKKSDTAIEFRRLTHFR